MSKIGHKRFLVTGGAGFIGSHLVDALLGMGAEKVSAVDNLFLGKLENLDAANGNKNFKFYNEDAGDIMAMDKIIGAEKPDVIFNLATKALLYSFTDPRDAFEVNTDIAMVLAELLRAQQYKALVHFSSSEVYGSAKYVPMNEDHPMNPETSYAAGKAAADLLLQSYANMYDLDIVTLRPFNNYGPRQNSGNYAALIPLTLERIKKREEPVIHGDGLQTRDFIYVGDTVNVCLEILKHDFAAMRGKTFNLSSGKETSVKEIVETLCKIKNYKGKIKYEPARPADVRRHLGAPDKLKTLLGGLTLTGLETGLKKTVDWYEK